MNVPKLRFKEFDGEWEERKLEESVSNIGTGKSEFKINLKSAENKFAILGSTSIIGFDATYDYEGEFILTARVGANAGNLYRYNGKVKISDNTVYIQGTNLSFVYALLNKFNLKKLSFGTGQPLIKASELKKLSLFYPNAKEQNKIGYFLELLNKKIRLQQQKIDLLQEQKKGYMQKIFRQDLRFKGFVEKWKNKSLESVVERITRKNKNLESNLPLTISAEKGLVDQITYFNKNVSGKDLAGYYLLKRGEFAYNKSYSKGYPWGAIKRLENYEMGVLSTLYICFKTTNINDEFLKHYFETTHWHKEVSMIAAEGARNHGLLNIPVNDFFKIKITIPSEEEQEKIAKFFNVIEEKLNLEQAKLLNLQKQKQGFMQQMFI